jgi:hypothetical protein
VYTQGAGNGEDGQPKQSAPNIPGFGIYHSGLQVFGTEYTFAGGEFDGSGVLSLDYLTPTNLLLNNYQSTTNLLPNYYLTISIQL